MAKRSSDIPVFSSEKNHKPDRIKDRTPNHREDNDDSSQRLRILNFNVRSLRNKVDQLNIYVYELDFPEVLCFTESWLSTEEVNELRFDGYKVGAHFCCSGQRGEVLLF
ncbi:hypothetical protein Zmor_026871 [Zophobas morio]|uniref:Uncharacterized protein n=1 Tax=Zophobas morio TaxID=2755281 RepID=A0AA38HWL5_9CUCU|nr:hypothetical protein Zmor_026871 [Zophobas morio]